MRDRIARATLGLGLLLATSCGETTPGVRDATGGAAGDAALADTLRALIADAYDFSRADVADRMAALFADTGDVVSASNGRVIASADSVRLGIRRFWDEAGRNMRDASWVWEDVYVERLGPDAAVLTGTWSIPHIAPGGEPHVIRGAWTAVFRRLDGRWSIVHEHLSSPASD